MYQASRICIHIHTYTHLVLQLLAAVAELADGHWAGVGGQELLDCGAVIHLELYGAIHRAVDLPM